MSQLSTTTILVSGINIALSITAILGNALILVALNRESSLNPPSKLFLRCLAFSDLCVGLIVQPVSVVSLLSTVYHRWNLCRFTELLWYSLSILMVGFSLATLTAISVDRLLALLLGIRYRQVVTMKRARLIVAVSLLMSIVNCAVLFADLFVFLLYCSVMWFLWLIMPIYCYVRIYFVLRNHIQAQVTPQGQQNGISPLNLSRYRKTVSSALWIFATLIICYAPFGFMLIVNAESELNGHLVILHLFCNTLVYLNSSLNPLLYCWKITEVRHAVKEILSNLGF
ncbi:adenosine receptor A3-like, partial [Oculina patagonica]